jgi:SHS2 domain-containing protein
MAQIGFYELDHTADWAIRVVAESLPQLFELAASGMFSLADIQLSKESSLPEKIKLEANDIESLLVLWLEELLFRIESMHIGAAEVTVHQVDQSCLQAEILPSEIVAIGRDIKAVTYHNLEIIQLVGQWSVEIVFDV